ncbi:MAG: DUF4126 domain-containing protein [Chloroflexota bacterium]|nr:DUF4126 domain-containing protein [Dehalococcoidia bacterium]MDW8252871.1 DUF4126 domain-containing protein [Chloroflexota bacterium]
MSELLAILTAFGISAPAGLNAYVPLLLVGITARFTSWITLNDPFTWLTNEWVLLGLALLFGVEFFADKIPGVDHANDVLNTVLRPAAGAILFAAAGNVISEIHPALAILLGVLAAGSVHAVKATARPVVTALTFGIATPVVSAIEDVLAGTTTILAIVAPLLLLLPLASAAVVIAWWWRGAPKPRPSV